MFRHFSKSIKLSNFASLFLFSLVFFTFPAQSQQAVIEGYEYDALGRLVKVTEGSSTKVVYCYDPAGNRVKVNRGDAPDPEDCDVPPPPVPVPPKPSSLQSGSHQGGGCYHSWTGSSLAAYYEIGLSSGTTVTSSGTSYEHNSLCATWVRACNSESACSSKAYF